MEITRELLLEREFTQESPLDYLVQREYGELVFSYHVELKEFIVDIDTGMGLMEIPFAQKIETIDQVDKLIELFIK